jgi:endonuclease III
MQKSVTDSCSKVIRISNENYQKIVAQGQFRDTFDSILTRILSQNEKKENDFKQND